MEIESIIEKIKDILSHEIDERRVFDKDVAAAFGMSKESFSQMKKKGNIPYEQVAKFCAKRKISINWVLFDQLPKSLEEETDKYSRVKHFTQINASAGGGGFNDDEGFEYLYVDKKLLDGLYKSGSAAIDSIVAINVVGDSMEPTLYDKEIILCDRDDREISRGGIFIVSTNAGLFVKRVALKVDSSLELISDNKSYNSEIIPVLELESIEVLGRVIGKVAVV